MKKDVVYIDIEDDITAVIDKVNSSKEKIIALVPPKGSAVLQSVVNLKLLRRAAEKQSKRIVVVTSNASLTSLAGGVGIYVARTLQSKPEIPSGEDFDEAADGPVELSDDVGSIKTNSSDDADDEVELTSEDIDLIEKSEDEPDKKGKPAKAAAKKPTGKKKKVPNFGSFRKKALMIGGGVLLLLIIFLALFGRTRSNIVIRAETTPIDVQFNATITSSGSTDLSSKTLRAQKQETKKNLSEEFAATGEKNEGNRATGAIVMEACVDGISAPGDISSGTTVSAEGKSYTTQESASFGFHRVGSGCVIFRTDSVGIQATERGKDSNISNAEFSVSGRSGTSASGSASGGTDKVVKVVSQADVDRARKALEDSADEDQVKKELRGGFDGEVKVLEDSFTVKLGGVRSDPAVGEEAGRARLTASATYTMLAVEKEELGKLLDQAIMAEVPNKDQQRVYQNGNDEAQFQKKSGSGDKITYQIGSVGRYGPRFDIDDLKERITGKKVGEVRSILQDLPGVNGVDIHLSPFWARNMPGIDKIEIKLDVDDSAN